jgi:hypothetical protein
MHGCFVMMSVMFIITKSYFIFILLLCFKKGNQPGGGGGRPRAVEKVVSAEDAQTLGAGTVCKNLFPHLFS